MLTRKKPLRQMFDYLVLGKTSQCTADNPWAYWMWVWFDIDIRGTRFEFPNQAKK